MRIRIIVFNAYVAGGTVRSTFNTARALTQLGHEVEIASLFQHRDQPAFSVPPGVELRTLAARRPAVRTWWHRPDAWLKWAGIAMLRRVPSRFAGKGDSRHRRFNAWSDLVLARYVRDATDGVLIGTRPALNLALAKLARPGVIVIGQEHMNLRQASRTLRGEYVAHLARLDAIVALTVADARRYHRLMGGRVRTLAIPNSNGRRDRTPVPWPRSGEVEDRVVVAAGRLVRQKGFDRLIRAWKLVAIEHPGWRLDIYGDGPLRATLQRQINRAGLAASVSLKGFSPRLAQHLAEASVFVLSSRFEGLPMVLLEAMSYGRPVVAVDCPTGPAELIEHGHNGLLVERGSIVALAATLGQAMAEPELRTRLGVAARSSASMFELDVVGRRWDLLLVELSSGSVTPRRGGVVLSR